MGSIIKFEKTKILQTENNKENSMTPLAKKVKKYRNMVDFPVKTAFHYIDGKYDCGKKIRNIQNWNDIYYKRFKIEIRKYEYNLSLHPKHETKKNKHGIHMHFLLGKTEDVKAMHEDYKNNPEIDFNAKYKLDWIVFNSHMDGNKKENKETKFVTIYYIAENKWRII